jgi:hypothetical protein
MLEQLGSGEESASAIVPTFAFSSYAFSYKDSPRSTKVDLSAKSDCD